ncbi:MAG: 1-acyl-sn-glycerol-3-phosphate acyltransferase [Bacteroidia bacterium]|nr:1-acyl-sn-glycerol-3-phosphate acyltransferase [Bacteroidia bacterium]
MESVQHYIQEGILYEPVIQDIHDWPIARLFQKKESFVQEVIEEALHRLNRHATQDGSSLEHILERTMYLERNRMLEDPWKVDPKDEPKFWGNIKKQLVLNEQVESDPALANARYQDMARAVISRYAHEIVSTFQPSSYHFAKRILPLFFSTLLNASAAKTLRAMIYHSVQLQERVHLIGETDAIRKLAKKGTVILVPTHISNMDSILVGWGLHALGLPAFIYGAGLNLFNTPFVSFFMKRLGAYKVDRRKRNPMYRETLEMYSTVAIREGVHSLFFPGGTRSRSGEIEKKLKLGLLGTAIEAQRRNFTEPLRAPTEKIFVVPLVMSYNFVLEAASLINQHLKSTGQEQYYIVNDEFSSITNLLKFVWTTFSASSDIVLGFGKPMDIFGNMVDLEGNSYDTHGRLINIREYFMSRGEIREDRQRDAEYTLLLGERIVERYHVENRVFSSHLVAFVAFEMFKRRHRELDLYGILRLQEDERSIPIEAYRATLDRVLSQLRTLADAGKVHLASHMINDTQTIIEQGIKNLGIYHAKRPLKLYQGTSVISDNMNLLYYYHNRLLGYGLERYV